MLSAIEHDGGFAIHAHDALAETLELAIAVGVRLAATHVIAAIATGSAGSK